MNAAVVTAAVSNVERVKKAWPKPPRWVVILAEKCDALGSQGKAAQKIGYGEATISQVLNNRYKGDLKKVQMAVQGAFMDQTVICPVLKEIPSDRCLSIQRENFTAVSIFRTQLYKACRKPCANYIQQGVKANDEER